MDQISLNFRFAKPTTSSSSYHFEMVNVATDSWQAMPASLQGKFAWSCSFWTLSSYQNLSSVTVAADVNVLKIEA